MIGKLEQQLVGLKRKWAAVKQKAAESESKFPTQNEIKAEMRKLRSQMKADRRLLKGQGSERVKSYPTSADSTGLKMVSLLCLAIHFPTHSKRSSRATLD